VKAPRWARQASLGGGERSAEGGGDGRRGAIWLWTPRGGAAVRVCERSCTVRSSPAVRQGPNEGQGPHEPAAELVAAGSAARTFNRVYLSALCANSLCERQRVFPQDA
jgi:hypothetical protein